MEFHTGELIDSNFEVIEEIGKGGMGKVLKVLDKHTSIIVALKYCMEIDPELLRRFSREVRIMSNIEHSNVISVLHHNLNYDPPYFVMPLANKSTLELVPELQNDHVEALRVFKEICKGIQAIHSLGTIHRDINPKNALVLENGDIVVSDLGLAKLETRDTTVLTQTNVMLGTQIYAAPEQYYPRGTRDSDERTDIYQLGKTLYHFLSNEIPILIDINKLTPGLTYIVTKATKQNPSERYQSVGALIDAITDYELSLDPYRNPQEAYKATLEEANQLLIDNKYSTENVNRIIQIVYNCRDDHSLFLEFFDRIPERLLIVVAKDLSSDFEPVLAVHCNMINNHINEYGFSYAEIVASKMSILYKHGTLEIKKYALKSILIAAVDRNRFKVIEIFNEIIKGISDPNEAVVVADALREELARYVRLFGQVSKSQLHPCLQTVWDAADSQKRK